jgi:hypothetical protein
LGTLSQGRQFYNHFWIEDTSGKTSGRNTILEILSQVWAFLKLFLIRRYFWNYFWKEYTVRNSVRDDSAIFFWIEDISETIFKRN